jgi:hypothetical protein
VGHDHDVLCAVIVGPVLAEVRLDHHCNELSKIGLHLRGVPAELRSFYIAGPPRLGYRKARHASE